LRALIAGPGKAARAVPAVVLLVVAASAPAIMSEQAETGLNWQPLTQQALIMAQRNNQPVLIEFTADWCINCKVLEHTVYNSPRVLAAAADAGLITLQADLTRPDKQLQQHLRHFGGAGLPYAVVLGDNGHISHKLPDLFTTDALVAAIREVTS